MLRRNGPRLEVRGVSPEAGRESMGERFVEEVGHGSGHPASTRGTCGSRPYQGAGMEGPAATQTP